MRPNITLCLKRLVFYFFEGALILSVAIQDRSKTLHSFALNNG